jgi:hypothetical protein
MVFTRPLQRRWMAWVAVWAILLGALAPTLSHAMRAWQHAPVTWVEVCSTTGAKLVAVSLDKGVAGKADPQSRLPGSNHAGEHCPFCLMHADDVAVLPSPPAPVLTMAFSTEALPSLFLHAPRTLFAWAPPQARAPPASV